MSKVYGDDILLSNLILSSNFSFNSRVKPFTDDAWNLISNVRVLSSTSASTAKIPNWTKDEIAAQISYNLVWKATDQYTVWTPQNYTFSVWNNSFTKHYANDPDWSQSWITNHRECFNIYVSWCWDWDLNDNPNSNEQCDDWNNINWDWCSATCQTEVPDPVNWVCWSANGITTNVNPKDDPNYNLCSIGNASNVWWTWPWSWTCIWLNSWTTASCSADKTPDPVNWVCWSANGITTNSNPKDDPNYNLCSVGNASSVWWTWPWSWTCIWLNNWTTASCSADKTPDPVNLKCWISNWKTFSLKPTVNLCSDLSTPNVNWDWPWIWQCQWVNWTCTANKSTISEHLSLNPPWWWGWWERWRRALCWNWIMDFELEECDDWNNMSWDWCSKRCHIEKVCWDWNIDAININWQREQCDDWNLIDWDWCSSTCEIDKVIIKKRKIVNQQFCWNWKNCR